MRLLARCFRILGQIFDRRSCYAVVRPVDALVIIAVVIARFGLVIFIARGILFEYLGTDVISALKLDPLYLQIYANSCATSALNVLGPCTEKTRGMGRTSGADVGTTQAVNVAYYAPAGMYVCVALDVHDAS